MTPESLYSNQHSFPAFGFACHQSSMAYLHVLWMGQRDNHVGRGGEGLFIEQGFMLRPADCRRGWEISPSVLETDRPFFGPNQPES